MTAPVWILAAGARTPVGLSPESAAAAVRAGVTRIEEHPFIVDLRGERVRAARDRLLDPELFGLERLVKLAGPALASALGQLGPLDEMGEVPLLIGTAEPRLGWTERDAAELARRLGQAAGPATWKPRVLAEGHASVLELLRQGAGAISEGTCQVCVVGGVESWLDPTSLLWLDAQGRLLAEGTRSGFPPGEAAGFLVLASEAAARALRRPPLAAIRTAHSSRETKLIQSDDVGLGEGLTAALSKLDAALRPRGERIDDIYCDLNGERYRTEEWGFAALRLHDLFRDVAIRPNGVASWGDVGAASGALLAVLAAQAWRRGYARGPRAVAWASSDRGLRSAVLLEAVNPDARSG